MTFSTAGAYSSTANGGTASPSHGSSSGSSRNNFSYQGPGSSAYSGGGTTSYGLNGTGGNSLGGGGSSRPGVNYQNSFTKWASENADNIGGTIGGLMFGQLGAIGGKFLGNVFKEAATAPGETWGVSSALGGLAGGASGGYSGGGTPGGGNGLYTGGASRTGRDKPPTPLYMGSNWTPTNNSGGLTVGSSAAAVNPTAGMSDEQKQAYWASQAALQNTQLNRPDQTTPFGSQTWTKDPKDPNKWVSNVTLSPDQQALLDAQNKGNLAKNDLANGLLAGFQKDGAPGWIGNAGLQTDLALNTRLTPSQITAKAAQATGASAGSGSIDLTGMTALPEVSDAVRQRVEQALYERSTSRMDPVWQQRQDALNAQLANQGITLGSGAFDTSVGQFGRDRNDAYQLAMNEAIVGGGTEQSRLFDLALKPRQQEFSERSKAADVSLSNAQMKTNARIASAHNATQTAIANAQMELEAAKLNAQNRLDYGNANNAAILNQGSFNNNAKLGNMTANNSAIDQMVNTIGKLSSGAGPTIPTFNSGMSGANVAPVDAAALRQQEYLKRQAKDNAKAQEDNALYSALGGLANSFISNTNLFG